MYEITKRQINRPPRDIGGGCCFDADEQHLQHQHQRREDRTKCWRWFHRHHERSSAITDDDVQHSNWYTVQLCGLVSISSCCAHHLCITPSHLFASTETERNTYDSIGGYPNGI